MEVSPGGQRDDAPRSTEKALSRSWYMRLYEIAPGGAAVVRVRDQRILDANPALCRMLGYTREELLAQTVADLTHHEDLPQDMAAVKKRHSGFKDTISLEKRLLAKDGSIIWVLAVSEVLEDNEFDEPVVIGMVTDISETVRAREKSRRVAFMLEQAERLASVGAWEWDLSTDTLRLSAEWRRIHGYNEAHARREDLMEIAHPDDRSKIHRAMEEVIKYRRPYNIEHRILRPDNGEIRYIRAHGEILSDEQKRPPLVYGSAQDITLNVLAQRALKESENRYRTIARNFPGGAIFLFNREMRYTFCEGKAFEDVGIDPADLIGKTIYEAWPEYMHSVIEKHVEIALAGGTSNYLLTYQGRLYDNYAAPIVSDDGKIHEGIVHAMEITRRHELENAYRASLEQLQNIARNTPGAVYQFRKSSEGEYSFPYVNEGAYRIFGISGEEMIRSPEIVMANIHPEDTALVMSAIRESEESLSKYQIEHRIVHPDGKVVWLHAESIPKKESDGSILWSGVAIDISDRKRIEEEKLALEKQMLQAQKLESLGVLAGGIAHDFNNLLMGIVGNTDLLYESIPQNSEEQRYLQEISNATTRAADLCRQMLAYAGMGNFTKEQVDVKRFVINLLPLIRSSISKMAHIQTRLIGRDVFILADPSQLSQVVMNLVVNASEALQGADGEIVVTIGEVTVSDADTAEYHIRPEEKGRFVYIEVEDTGCGMDKETAQRVFDPFFTTKFTGRGLGMSAVLGIIRRHKGGLYMQTAPGKGTRFRVLFPECSSAPEAKPRPISTDETQQSESKRILFVDDEAVVRRVSAEMLIRLGVDVLEAADGPEALDIYTAESECIDLVILDLTMPKMNGENVLRQLKEIDPTVRVLISSGYGEPEVLRRLKDLPFDGFIDKPFRRENLMDHLKRLRIL